MEKYHEIGEVGSGSFAVVWKAFNKQTGEAVAIKKLKRKYNSEEECMNERELKSLIDMKNKHPNIVTLKDYFKKQDTLHLVLEYMECNLYERMVECMEELKLFSENEIRNICFQVFNGLAHMHQNGYFHWDLKPENLLMNKDIVKISDLGEARETNAQEPFTYDVTTLTYRAPDVFLRAPMYNSAVDMWAMGAIIVELLTLKPLFQGYDVMDEMCKVLGTPTESTWLEGLELAKGVVYKFPESPGVRFSELLPNASPDLLNLVATLLSWQPSSRLTAFQVLQHPFFQSSYPVPTNVRLEDTHFTPLNSMPLVQNGDAERVFEEDNQYGSMNSCKRYLEKVDLNEDFKTTFLNNCKSYSEKLDSNEDFQSTYMNSCKSYSEKVDSNEDLIHFLPADLYAIL